MENNITKIPIKNSGKGVTLPLNSWKRGYGPPPLVLTCTDDPPLWGPSPPPPKKKRTFPYSVAPFPMRKKKVYKMLLFIPKSQLINVSMQFDDE